MILYMDCGDLWYCVTYLTVVNITWCCHIALCHSFIYRLLTIFLKVLSHAILLISIWSAAVCTNLLMLCLEASRIGSGRIALHAGILKPSGIRMSIDSSSRGSIHSGPFNDFLLLTNCLLDPPAWKLLCFNVLILLSVVILFAYYF